MLQRDDWVDRAGESQLDRPAHLSAVDACGHDCAERADIEEVPTHPFARLVGGVATALALLVVALQRVPFGDGHVSALVGAVQNRLFLDVDVERRPLILHQTNEVAHLALQRDVGHQPVAGLGVQARQVAGVGVAVRIAVLDVEQQDEVVAVGDGHGHSLSVDLVKKACLWW